MFERWELSRSGSMSDEREHWRHVLNKMLIHRWSRIYWTECDRNSCQKKKQTWWVRKDLDIWVCSDVARIFTFIINFAVCYLSASKIDVPWNEKVIVLFKLYKAKLCLHIFDNAQTVWIGFIERNGWNTNVSGFI